VEQQVITRLFDVLSLGKRVVLEFILYEDPPRPLLRYQHVLAARGIGFITRVLRPDVEEILHDAERQVRVLSSPRIAQEWVLDTTNLTVDEVYDRYFQRVVEH